MTEPSTQLPVPPQAVIATPPAQPLNDLLGIGTADPWYRRGLVWLLLASVLAAGGGWWWRRARAQANAVPQYVTEAAARGT